jgi:site-specific recombinase XerD
MRYAHLRAADEGSRDGCRDAIERFLDRSWLLEPTTLQALNGHRFALSVLDDWLQRHRVVTLTSATAADVRALLNSKYWDSVSRRCESLLGLITRFYFNLRDSKVRPDDPIETLIDQEIVAAAERRKAVRSARSNRPGRRLHFSTTSAVM